MCIQTDVDTKWILNCVEKMCGVETSPGTREKHCSIFSTQESNSFVIKSNTEFCLDELPALLRSSKKRTGKGSLNTVWTYTEDGERSNVKELDSYFDTVGDYFSSWSTVERPAVMLNRRFYLIWKFPEYLTPYHQDNHVPPHFTFYNQISGSSIFHFLPKLVGQYISWLAAKGGQSAKSVKVALEELDRRGIGTMAVVNPGDLLMILPFGCHGVWVPNIVDNSKWCAPFEVSTIRAAEMFLRPIYFEKQKAMMRNDISWRYLAPIHQYRAPVKP